MSQVIIFLRNKKIFLWLLLAILSLVSFFPLKTRFFELSQEYDVQRELGKLVQKDALYVNTEQILGASTDSKVYSILKTASGDYFLSQLVKAKLDSSEFVGDVTFRLPNGDLYTTTSGSYVPEIVLRDGSKTDGQIVKGALTTVELKNGNFLALEIINAEIDEGRVSGVFSGRTTDSGYQIAASIKQGIIEEGYVVESATFVSSRIRTFGYLVLYEERKIKVEEDVLAAASDKEEMESETSLSNLLPSEIKSLSDPLRVTSYQGRIIQPNYDTGTYSIAGLDEESPISLNLIKDLVDEGVANIDFSSIVPASQVAYGGVVTSENIEDLTIEAIDIADDAILSRHIKDGEVTGADIKNDTIKNEDISGGAINSAKVEDNTLTTSDLSNTLSFGD